jgi:two-component system CheB/CheR fusion protein
VGVGASAGGLEALQEFVRHLPDKAYVTYVIAQHMSPSHKSHLVDLLQRLTDKKVSEVKNDEEILPDRIYITPPSKNISIKNNRFELKEPALDSILAKPSIDLFFNSLANAFGRRAVGIILSGTGRDGTMGMRAIQAREGITIVQDPESAKYDGMPLSSINDQIVDIIVLPGKIGEELVEVFDFINGDLEFKPSQTQQIDRVNILSLVKQTVGVDFSKYKTTTINRRIQRRMVALHLEEAKDYLNYLLETPDEVTKLFKDLLIGVTSFFRDRESFADLKELLKQQLELVDFESEKFRVWSIGCATGEEAYSIAFMLYELLNSKVRQVNIFATDLDADAISIARRGIYSEAAIAHLPKDFIIRFFEKVNDEFRVIKPIRDMIVFSIHDVTFDPPFSKINLISCRNLLIYFNPELQSQVLGAITYALKNGGTLFIGSSETIGSFDDSFTSLSKEAKIFKKIYNSSGKNITYNLPVEHGHHFKSSSDAYKAKQSRKEQPIQELLLKAIGDYFFPMSVVINETQNVVYARDKIPYLSLAPGVSNLQILKMVPPELEMDLRTVIHQAKKTNQPQLSRFIEVKLFEDYHRFVRIVAIPLSTVHDRSELMVISFQEEKEETLLLNKIDRSIEMQSTAVKQLEHDLQQTRHQLQALVEELETSNEELQATNEELQSSNEELQSTNEELETTNEELQSTNEEIQVAYNELQFISDEHEKQRNIAEDVLGKLEIEQKLLKGVSDSSTSGIMAFKAVRNSDFDIVDFEWVLVNEKAGKIVGKKAGDLLGKHLLQVMPGNKQEGLFDIYKEVTTSRKNIEREFYYQHENLSHWFYQVIVPFLDGFVVTFTDITDKKIAQEKIRNSEIVLRGLFENMSDGVAVFRPVDQGDGFTLADFNASSERLFSYYHKDNIGKKIHELINDDGFFKAFIKASSTDKPVRHVLKKIEEDDLSKWINCYIFTLPTNEIVSVFNDVTEQKKTEKTLIDNAEVLEKQVAIRTRELEYAKNKAENADNAKSQFLANMSHELRTPMHAILSFSNLALKKEDDPKIQRYLQNIRTSGIRLTGLLDDLLDLSKLESGAMNLNLHLQDLTTLVQHAISEVSSLLDDKSISIKMNTQQHFDALMDHKLMTQVVVNLLSNAIKFSPLNSIIDIDISCSVLDGINEKQGGKHDSILLTITDEGIGIPQNELELIFDKFAQSSKTSSGIGGTGLGLPITKEIISLHKGKAWAVSPPLGKERGAAFFIEIPVNCQAKPKTEKFDFEKAIAMHVGWKEKMESMFLSGNTVHEIPLTLIGNENLCSLGQWLNSNNIEDDELHEMHCEFHQLMEEYVSLLKLDKKHQASMALKKYQAVSDQLVEKLKHMKAI